MMCETRQGRSACTTTETSSTTATREEQARSYIVIAGTFPPLTLPLQQHPPPTQTLVPRLPNPIPMSDRLRNPVLCVQDSCASWLQIAVGVASKLHPAPASGAGQEYQEYQGARRPGSSGRWGIMEGGRSTLFGVDVYQRGRRFLGGHKRELCWRNLDSEIYVQASSVRDLIKALLPSMLIEAL